MHTEDADARLSRAEGELVAPIDALFVAAVFSGDIQTAAHVRHLRVGKTLRELAQRVRRPRTIRVGERNYFPIGLAYCVVLGSNFAATHVADHPGAR